jgi:uncharacterized protein YydD (DUF2326 family)
MFRLAILFIKNEGIDEVLPDMIRRRFNEVELFHRTIIENRRAHLNAEIASAEARIAEREQRTEERDRRRRQIMSVLNSGGALEHYTSLREEAGRAEAEVEGLRQRLETAERIESTKAELDIERASLTKALRDDLHERDAILREAILAFEALSESLYTRRLAALPSTTLPTVHNSMFISRDSEARASPTCRYFASI